MEECHLMQIVLLLVKIWYVIVRGIKKNCWIGHYPLVKRENEGKKRAPLEQSCIQHALHISRVLILPALVQHNLPFIPQTQYYQFPGVELWGDKSVSILLRNSVPWPMFPPGWYTLSWYLVLFKSFLIYWIKPRQNLISFFQFSKHGKTRKMLIAGFLSAMGIF